MGRDRIDEFKSGLSTVLTRFTKEWEIYLYYLTIEAEYGLYMRLDNIAGQIRHDDHLPVGLGNGRFMKG